MFFNYKRYKTVGLLGLILIAGCFLTKCTKQDDDQIRFGNRNIKLNSFDLYIPNKHLTKPLHGKENNFFHTEIKGFLLKPKSNQIKIGAKKHSVDSAHADVSNLLQTIMHAYKNQEFSLLTSLYLPDDREGVEKKLKKNKDNLAKLYENIEGLNIIMGYEKGKDLHLFTGVKRNQQTRVLPYSFRKKDGKWYVMSGSVDQLSKRILSFFSSTGPDQAHLLLEKPDDRSNDGGNRKPLVEENEQIFHDLTEESFSVTIPRDVVESSEDGEKKEDLQYNLEGFVVEGGKTFSIEKDKRPEHPHERIDTLYREILHVYQEGYKLNELRSLYDDARRTKLMFKTLRQVDRIRKKTLEDHSKIRAITIHLGFNYKDQVYVTIYEYQRKDGENKVASQFLSKEDGKWLFSRIPPSEELSNKISNLESYIEHKEIQSSDK